ncbi:MAG: GNAT family N-acetyltransferase [Candidatus Margulisbacteria bacterium]|nr:GNAT family N-acetyltransferase [Candidatus Margulisiibacteriota bacterium]
MNQVTNKIELKKALGKDVAYIYALYNEEIHTTWSEDDFHLFRKENNKDLYKILLNENCVGFIMLVRVKPEADLINIAVAKPLQSIGIGTMALEKLYGQLRKKGINKINLEVKKDSKAHKFYLKNGFLTTGCREKYYIDQTDAILMLKNI